jgi:hypothetical protein
VVDEILKGKNNLFFLFVVGCTKFKKLDISKYKGKVFRISYVGLDYLELVIPNQHDYTLHLRISNSIVESVMGFGRDNFISVEITGKGRIV